MNFALLAPAISNILYYFEWSSGERIYFYYDIALLASLLIGTALSLKFMVRNISQAGRKHLVWLGIVVLAFVFVELLFIQPTHQLYNDEYIHMSIAKTMIYDHYAGICSFNVGPHCVNGTAGLLQQPTGWATMLIVPFIIFGISDAAGYNFVLLLSCISIILVFYVAFMLLKDRNTALLSAALFAFTPLFMTFTRSLILDTPELMVFMLALALTLTYLKERKFAIGVAACVALAYTLIMKVDAIIVLPIALVILLAVDWNRIVSPSKGDLKKLAALVILLAAIIVPQLIFLYNSWTYNTFGAGPGQARISLGNLENNTLPNVFFWFGGFGGIASLSGWQQWQHYNIEYPLMYSLLAILGAAMLLRARRRVEATVLLLWFLIIFLFYGTYYGGGVQYGAGDDVRYFMSAFPVVSMLASASITGMISEWKRKMPRTKRKRAGGLTMKSKKRLVLVLAISLLTVMAFELVFQIYVFAAKPPQEIIPFSAERFQQAAIYGNLEVIPRGCFVLTYEPPLWNVVNVSNIYADWYLSPYYRNLALNLSHGCLYFEYSLDCVINTGGYRLDNTTPGCTQLQNMFDMSPVVQQHYDTFGWNYTFTIYRINSYRNGTALLGTG